MSLSGNNGHKTTSKQQVVVYHCEHVLANTVSH